MINEDELDRYMGQDVNEVVDILRDQYPEFKFYPIPVYAIVTSDYLPNRYRVWYDQKTRCVVDITHG